MEPNSVLDRLATAGIGIRDQVSTAEYVSVLGVAYRICPNDRQLERSQMYDGGYAVLIYCTYETLQGCDVTLE